MRCIFDRIIRKREETLFHPQAGTGAEYLPKSGDVIFATPVPGRAQCSFHSVLNSRYSPASRLDQFPNSVSRCLMPLPRASADPIRRTKKKKRKELPGDAKKRKEFPAARERLSNVHSSSAQEV